MRSVAVTVAGLGLVASAAAGTVSVSFNRRSHNSHRGVSLTRRDGGIDLEAVNNITGGGYYSEFEIGSPGQKLSFLLDTGSSDTWVNSVDADVCNSQNLQDNYGYCQATFNPDDSDSFKVVDRDGFNITYLDGRNIVGDYFNDTVTIGDSSIKNQQLGLATTSVRPTGIMGLGFDSNVAARTPYATVIDNMLSQGLIKSAAFSLYLNDLDSTDGTILFGGIDTERFIGSLAKLPVISDEATTGSDNITSYAIKLQGFKVSGSDNAGDIDSFDATAILDSGSTISLLPDSQVQQLWDLFDVRSIRSLQVPFVDCAWAGSKGQGYSLDFEFDGKTISVPLDQMVIDSFGDDKAALKDDPTLGSFFDGFDSVCMFGVGAASEYGVSGDNWALLGDTFLRSAYVVYDLSNQQLGLAQANLNASDSNIVAFGDNSDIPDASGVKAQEQTDDGDSAAGHLAPPLSAIVTLIMLMVGVVALL